MTEEQVDEGHWQGLWVYWIAHLLPRSHFVNTLGPACGLPNPQQAEITAEKRG
jgi:hypothetical protein